MRKFWAFLKKCWQLLLGIIIAVVFMLLLRYKRTSPVDADPLKQRNEQLKQQQHKLEEQLKRLKEEQKEIEQRKRIFNTADDAADYLNEVLKRLRNDSK